MKTPIAICIVAMLAGSGAAASAADGTTVTQSPTDHAVWIEGQFRNAISSCISGAPRNFKYVPDEVIKFTQDLYNLSTDPNALSATRKKEWSTKTSSLNQIFSEVYLASGNTFRKTSNDLPLPFENNSSVIIPNTNKDNLVNGYDCISILTANLGAGAGFSQANLTASLKTSLTSNKTKSIYIIGGELRSPVAALLNVNSSQSKLPTFASPFAMKMLTWRWYSLNSNLLSDGEAGRLKILGTVSGVGLFTTSSITQKALLNGSIAARGGIVLVNAQGDASASLDGTTGLTSGDYSSSIVSSSAVQLPGPKALAADLSSSATWSAWRLDRPEVTDSKIISGQIELASMPQATCQPSDWAVASLGQAPAGEFDVALNSVNWLSETSSCRFTVSLKPKAASEAAAEAIAAVKFSWAIKGQGAPNAPGSTASAIFATLDLVAPEKVVADLRLPFRTTDTFVDQQAITFSGNDIEADLKLNIYVASNSPSLKLVSSSQPSAPVAIECDGLKYYTSAGQVGIQYTSQSFQLISVPVKIKKSFISGSTGTCKILGPMIFPDNSSKDRSISVLAAPFVVKISGPQAASSVSGSTPTTPGGSTPTTPGGSAPTTPGGSAQTIG